MRQSHKPILNVSLSPCRLLVPALLCAGLAALWLCPQNTPARLAPVPTEAPSELRLITPDTLFVAHVNVAALLRSEVTRPLLDFVMLHDNRGKKEDFGLREFGVRVGDIKTVVVLGGETRLLTLVTAQKPLDRDQVVKALAPGARVHTIKERTLHIRDTQRDSFPRVKDGPPPPARREFDSWAPTVLFLNDNTFVVGQADSMVHFAHHAVKLDDKHPLYAAATKAGTPHVTIGVNLPEKLRAEGLQEMRRDLFREIDDEPITAMTVAALRPLLHAHSAILTAEVGDSSRAEVVAQFGTQREAARGRDAALIVLHLLKGGVTHLEEELTDSIGADKLKGSKILSLFDAIREGLDAGSVKVEGSTVKMSVKLRTEADLVKAFWTEGVARLQGGADYHTAVNNFKQVGIAIHNYSSNVADRLPPAAILSQDGKPLFSWRVALLPYLEEDALYKQLKLDEPWNSEHNKKILDKVKMPKVFELPGVKAPEGHTFLQLFTGPGSVYPDAKQPRYSLATMPDGTANTIFLIEAAEAVHWAAPGDIALSPRVSPLKQIGNHYGKGTLLGRFDGSVTTLSRKMTETDLRNAISPDDGNVMPDYWSGIERGRKRTRADFGDRDKVGIPKDKVAPPAPPPPPR